MSSHGELVLDARHLSKTYRRGREEVRAVDDVSLAVRTGEFVSLTGPSGSGKTTLLNLLGCLDNPTSGTLSVGGKEIVSGQRVLSEQALTRHRREWFGYIFQGFYLIPTLTVAENVALPLAFYRKDRSLTDLGPLLASLGLENRLRHLPGQLSGGEMQRVAIARALVNRPAILLADEPTGNLDSQRGAEIGRTLRTLNRQEGLTILLVTHDPDLAGIADRTLRLNDGRLA